MKGDEMQNLRRLVMLFVVLACAVPNYSYAIKALDFKKYFPDKISDFSATGDVTAEDLSKSKGMFHRAQRTYGSQKGAMCILAFVKGASVPQTIKETFAKGSKIKIEDFDAVQIGPDNNIVAASVKLDKDFLITAVVLNSEDKEVPINILNKLKLVDLSSLSKKAIDHAPLTLEPSTLFPSYSIELSGNNEVRIKNPNAFKVMIGIRSENGGKNFEVASNGIASVMIPNGNYKIYFVYSSKPEALFQGDDFSLNNNGIEIQIVKVVGGNYGIRQVK
jgi:hypothetical protein